ncbi:alcohol dehydrogenase catalytic domain-containing protein [Pseudonocardia benzenivorans]
MPTPSQTTAAVLVDYNVPPELRSLPVPELEPGAALVKVEASTMCGTDVHIWRGEYAAGGLSKLPLVPGHEIVGRVVALGSERRVDALNRPLAEETLSPGPTRGAGIAIGAPSPSNRPSARVPECTAGARPTRRPTSPAGSPSTPT